MIDKFKDYFRIVLDYTTSRALRRPSELQMCFVSLTATTEGFTVKTGFSLERQVCEGRDTEVGCHQKAAEEKINLDCPDAVHGSSGNSFLLRHPESRAENERNRDLKRNAKELQPIVVQPRPEPKATNNDRFTEDH